MLKKNGKANILTRNNNYIKIGEIFNYSTFKINNNRFLLTN